MSTALIENIFQKYALTLRGIVLQDKGIRKGVARPLETAGNCHFHD